MESKKGFGKQLGQWIEGSGFYIVMLLCALIIGVSIWSLLRTPAATVDEPVLDDVLSEVEPMPYMPEVPDLADDVPVAEAPEESAEPMQEDTGLAVETAAEDRVVWPVDGEVARTYSMDALQYDETMADWRTHDGIDISAAVGTKVLAIRAGTVQNVYVDDRYGTTVVIDHGNGLICSYSNLESIPTVYAGDTVKGGDVIGSVGDTALAETAQDSHLHLSAARNGESVSPIEFLPQKS